MKTKNILTFTILFTILTSTSYSKSKPKEKDGPKMRIAKLLLKVIEKKSTQKLHALEIKTKKNYNSLENKISNSLPKKIPTSIELITPDFILDFGAGIKFDSKIDEYYKKAKSCVPEEIDLSTGGTVDEWMKYKPATPDYDKITHFVNVLNNAKTYSAKKSGTDKTKHCFAGCYIQKKLDFKSAKMAAWLKELVDTSDCKTSTHFEVGDYYATLAGAVASKNKRDCEKFCHQEDFKEASGEFMYEQAMKK